MRPVSFLRFFLAALMAGSLAAQTTTGALRGPVTDPNGAVIPGATVDAINTQTGVRYSTTTNEAGIFSIPEAPAGSYTVTVEHPGFRRAVRQGITIATGELLALNTRLELGPTSEAVTITAQTPQVQSETSSIGQLIESKSIMDLPLGDRRTMNVIQMNGAAVFTGYDNGQKPNFILAGGRAQRQMLWVDGGSGQNMRLGIGQIYTDPPVELVAEIKVLSNNYAAEYGASAGGVIIETTKSGGNQFRGSAYEYLRNDAVDAPGFFAPVQNGAKVKPELRYNVFGTSLGGPIRRNKAFFFFDYEGQRRRTGVVQSLTVPTDPQRAGDFSQTLNAKGQVIPIYDPSTSVRLPFDGNRMPK